MRAQERHECKKEIMIVKEKVRYKQIPYLQTIRDFIIDEQQTC